MRDFAGANGPIRSFRPSTNAATNSLPANVGIAAYHSRRARHAMITPIDGAIAVALKAMSGDADPAAADSLVVPLGRRVVVDCAGSVAIRVQAAPGSGGGTTVSVAFIWDN